MQRGFGPTTHATKAWKVVVLKGKLKTVEKTIETLKNTIDKCRQEARELQSKLLVSEAQLGSTDV